VIEIIHLERLQTANSWEKGKTLLSEEIEIAVFNAREIEEINR